VQVLSAPDCVIILTAPKLTKSACPLCAVVSGQVHSHYTRTLADLPWQGRQAKLQVRARRFRCVTAGCLRQVFAERLPDVAQPQARRTVRLHGIQRHIGFALGGEPGARLAARLAMPVSGATLLRLVRASTPAVMPPPHVIGVDDWAWRRGRRYGTIICDLERRKVIDLLPDRSAGTLAAWLRQHGQEVSTVSRDRSGAYADGIRSGAPEAVQVADRWHLVVNASDALRQVLDRHQRQLREAAQFCASHDGVPLAVVRKQRASTQADRRQGALREQRGMRYEEVARLQQEGVPIKRIAQQLGMARNTVRRWLRAGEVPIYRRATGRSALDGHLRYVEQRLAEGCRNTAQLWRELRDRGFTGGYDIVRRWAIRRRALDASIISRTRPLPSWHVPSSRRTARLLTTPSEALTQAERRFVDTLSARSPEIAAAASAINAFHQMVRDRDVAALDVWLTTARSTDLRGFVTGLISDIDAVRAALSQPWSNGPVEGQVNRLKLLKRQMYGRANFGLLRSRVLHVA